jgi:hypothetical protein
MDQFEGVTRFEPFTFSSNEFLELQRNEEDTPLIGQMKLGNNYIHLNSVFLFIFFFIKNVLRGFSGTFLAETME